LHRLGSDPAGTTDDVGGLVVPAMRDAVARLDPATRAVAEYHLGWSDAPGAPGSGGGGKMLRAALALLGARAVGAPPEVAIPGAVAVELVHNFSLLHDDLIDADTQRRHRATVWSLHGAPAAILTGDALAALAGEVLLEVEGPSGVAAGLRLAVANRQLIQGQMEDMALERNLDAGVVAVLRMAEHKTAALLSASVAIGAVLADAPAESITGLADYGRHLGLAFQLVDDVLGIWGDPARTGKPALSDLRARKTSLPVAWAMERGGPAAAALRDGLAGEAPDEGRLVELAAVLAEAGAADWARSEARSHARSAIAALKPLEAPAQAHSELADLAEFVVLRER
jgi:geranylgeranyl diphosphate synthase type I